MPLGDLYGNHWSTSGRNTPDAASPDDAVYLPGRNAMLTLKPALWCVLHGIEELALAVLASNPFADATDRFFHDFARALGQATQSRLRFTRPFAQLGKKDVMELGRGLPLEVDVLLHRPGRWPPLRPMQQVRRTPARLSFD